MLVGYDLLALGAALCWAIANFLSAEPAEAFGAIRFTRIRLLLVSVMLWTTISVWQGVTTGHWLPQLPLSALLVMSLSAFIGLTIGDTALFVAFNRIGPRRSNILFATNALFGMLIGIVWLQEMPLLWELLGSLLVVSGVMIAIRYGRHRDDVSYWEQDKGSVAVGIAFGLLAGFCQALSAALMKPVLTEGVNPITASAVRMSVGALLLYPLVPLQHYGLNAKQARPLAQIMTWRLFWLSLSSSFFALALGMTLLVTALKYGNVSMVLVLSSVTPVLLLPLLWLIVRRPPALGAWLGAIVTVIGTALILTH